MLGGEGAPYYGGFPGFIEEHFGRTRETTHGTAENNRLSFDLTLHFPELRGARFYYEIAFEDTRKAFINSLQYDADHLLGLEFRNLRLGPFRRIFVEVEHTGWVSQEHGTFTTGMTNRERTLGDALGPDGLSIWARGDFQAGKVTLSPWLEFLRFVSDVYGSNETAGVFVVATGPIEHRQRIGADVRAVFSDTLGFSLRVFGERIGNADLVEGSTKYGGGAIASATFRL